MNELDIPDCCVVCYSNITLGTSVLFHCECVIALCQSCAFQQICSQRYTYLRGLLCPCCRVPSFNIIGVDQCQLAERRLITSAAKYFSKKRARGEHSVRHVLKCAILAGHGATITVDDLMENEEDGLGAKHETATMRLELARIEQRRLDKTTGPLPLGPLEYIKITRNMYLEHAISLQAKLIPVSNPSDPEMSLDPPLSLPAPPLSPPKPNTRTRRQKAVDVDVVLSSAEPVQLCVCGNEEDGFYVQCSLGTGGCNGWVHPECIPELRGT
jgi:hypothetical protein